MLNEPQETDEVISEAIASIDKTCEEYSATKLFIDVCRLSSDYDKFYKFFRELMAIELNGRGDVSFKDRVEALGFTQRSLSEEIGIHYNTVNLWCKNNPPAYALTIIDLLEFKATVEQMSEIFKEKKPANEPTKTSFKKLQIKK